MRGGQPAGFTLFEVLVALAVLGFTMVGLAQGARFGVRAWDMQGRVIDKRSELDAVDRALRRFIERADPGGGKEPASLQGTADHVAFTSELPAAASGAARRADMVVLVSGGRLVLRWAPHLHVRRLGPRPAPAEEELLRGVRRAEFAYWSPTGGWVGAWSEQALPALVRVRLVFPEGDRRRWPDVVAAPLLRGRPGE